MAYKDVVRIENPAGQLITSVDVDLVQVAARRPFYLLGFGIAAVDRYIAGSGAVGGTIKLQRSVDGGATFTDVDTLVLPNANHAAGKAFERSELLRGRAPAAPEAVMAALAVEVGHVIRIRVTTAQAAGTGGTAGRYTAYALVAPRGSL